MSTKSVIELIDFIIDYEIGLRSTLSMLKSRSSTYNNTEMLYTIKSLDYKTHLLKEEDLSRNHLLIAIYTNLNIFDIKKLRDGDKNTIIPGIVFSNISSRGILAPLVQYILYGNNISNLDDILVKLLDYINKCVTKNFNKDEINILFGYLKYGTKIEYRNIIAHSRIIKKILDIKGWNIKHVSR